ncbi:MAG: PIN domain-containing protein [Desulfobacteraceae bacterium]|nr:PIN domain-containing protein [Desulfobacteraceae bacterium]
MKVLFDTNVVLDLLMDRMPFADAAVRLFSLVEDGSVVGYLCGTTVTTVFYLAAKAIGTAQARAEIGKLLNLFEIAPANRPVIESALAAAFGDFEDAVIHEAACHVGADAIVTRNLKDFVNARIPVYAPEDMARLATSTHGI